MLIWDWKQKIGKATLQKNNKEYEITLYKGNALIIMLYEFTDDKNVEKFELINFFADREHLRNCLKECPHIFKDFKKFEFFGKLNKDLWFFIMKMSELGIGIEVNLPFEKIEG